MNQLSPQKGLIKTNVVTPEAKNTFKKRTIIAVSLLPIFVPCLVLGGWFFFSLVLLVIGAATYEIAKAPSRKLSWALWFLTFVIMYALVYWTMLKVNLQKDWADFDINTSFTSLNISPFAMAVMVGLYFFVVIIKSEQFSVLDACYLIAVTLLLALGFQAILCVRYLPFAQFSKHINSNDEQIAATLDISTPTFKYAHSMFLMIYLLLGIFFNDIGAYVIGMYFGKHKMNPRISPNKTWEGFVGGVLISMILTLIFGLTVAYCGMPILPVLGAEHWYWIILISIFLPLSANLGDFTFSAIKREFYIKDYSKTLGPHGGILDRIDSTIFGALALVILIIFISNEWNFLV